jgi:hypothetical protein
MSQHRGCRGGGGGGRLRADIARLEEELESSSNKLKIVMRFVDWYAEHGQVFQHNADLVERHLESLAHRSVPACIHTVEFLGKSKGGQGSTRVSSVATSASAAYKKSGW